MTKARDLANIISGGFTADDIPNLDASKITSGSLGVDRIPNLAASKITSGTFADGRIASSNVSQHATSFDDNDLVNDISTLGLRVHTQENLNISNTNSAYFDVFKDNTGINFTTTANKNESNQLIATDGTVADGTEFTINGTNYTTYIKSDPKIFDSALAQSDEAAFSNNSSSGLSGSLGTKGANIWTDTGGSSAWAFQNYRFTDDRRSLVIFELNDAMRLRGASGKWRNGAGSSMAWHLYGIASDGYSQTSPAGYPNISQASGNSGGMSNGTTYSSAGTWNNDTTFPYLGIFVRPSSNQTYMYDNLTVTGNIPTPVRGNATGAVFTSNAITAPSTTSMGAVITYSETGTNTLNTDIVLQLSADNGSNFSTATLTALPNFATNVKCAKVNDVSVTAGTQLKYKLTYANQSGTKLAKVSGISLQF